jgi:rhamnosyltransferase
MAKMQVSVVIPTYNAQQHFLELFAALNHQSIEYELIVMDSCSKDGTPKAFEDFGAKVIHVPKGTFNHGGTRNEALKYTSGDVIIYLTQDAIPKDKNTFKYLIDCFDNPQVAIAYGRQLPYPDATVFGEFNRLFNYPPESILKDVSSTKRLGVKTCFNSNSFAAYRKTVLNEVGGFPTNVIMCEDIYVGGKAILAGYKIAYCAESQVIHSHNYSIWEEGQRYFDIGVFYSKEPWIAKNFKSADGEGFRFIKEQFSFLIKNRRFLKIPEFFIRNFMKLLMFKLSGLERYLPKSIKKMLSKHNFYWD